MCHAFLSFIIQCPLHSHDFGSNAQTYSSSFSYLSLEYPHYMFTHQVRRRPSFFIKLNPWFECGNTTHHYHHHHQHHSCRLSIEKPILFSESFMNYSSTVPIKAKMHDSTSEEDEFSSDYDDSFSAEDDENMLSDGDEDDNFTQSDMDWSDSQNDGNTSDASANEDSDKKNADKKDSRVTIDYDLYQKLKIRARHYGINPSKLLDIVLDKYITEYERFLYGKPFQEEAIEIPTEDRAYDLVIFEVEGFLCNNREVTEFAMLEALYRTEKIRLDPIPYERDYSAIRKSPYCCNEYYLMERIAQDVHKGYEFDQKKIMEEFLYLYSKKYSQSATMTPFEGVKDLIIRLKQLGLKTAAVSMSSKAKTVLDFKALTIAPSLVDFLVGRDEMGSKKLEITTDTLVKIAKYFDINPSRTIFISSAPYAVKNAQECGMRSILIRSKSPHYQIEDDIKANVEVTEPGNLSLEEILGGSLSTENVLSEYEKIYERVVSKKTEKTTEE